MYYDKKVFVFKVSIGKFGYRWGFLVDGNLDLVNGNKEIKYWKNLIL